MLFAPEVVCPCCRRLFVWIPLDVSVECINDVCTDRPNFSSFLFCYLDQTSVTKNPSQ